MMEKRGPLFFHMHANGVPVAEAVKIDAPTDFSTRHININSSLCSYII